MHHSEQDFDMDEAKRLRELLRTEASRMELGATGEFPDGQLGGHDEGEIAFAVGTYKGKVVVNFGKPVASLGMTGEQARGLARLLMAKAARVAPVRRGGKGRRRRRK